jgi:heme-degrading monooxygenase HmoA
MFNHTRPEIRMIIREWRGRAAPGKAEAYPAHFRRTVLPELRGNAGFCGAHLSQRRTSENIEFLVLTRWQSMEAIRAFAGADPERAVIEPGAVAALIDFDADVRHYEVLEDVRSAT